MAKSKSTVIILTLLITATLLGILAALVWIGYILTQSKPELKSPVLSKSKPELKRPVSVNAVNTFNSLDQVELTTTRHVDYTQLRNYLQSKDWQAADRETYLRLLDVAGSKAQALGWTPQDEMDTLSCVDLRTIDQLWTIASDNKLGFSIQRKILKDDNSDYRKMYDQVGWQTLTGEWLIQWNYNQQTKRYEYKPGKEPNFKTFPLGHLPTVERGYNFDVSIDGRLAQCGF
jgi:hypothetical protein